MRLASSCWLTDDRKYLARATGDSARFSTHEGREYRAGTLLQARRARNQMPLPLVLAGTYVFRWIAVDATSHWHRLAVATPYQDALVTEKP